MERLGVERSPNYFSARRALIVITVKNSAIPSRYTSSKIHSKVNTALLRALNTNNIERNTVDKEL